MRTTLLLALLALFVRPTLARARDREWRLSATAGGSYQPVAAAETSTAALLAGGGVRYAYGLSHVIELGGVAAIAYANDLELADAVIGDQPGTLWTDAYTVTLAADVRFLGGLDLSHAFVRTHPLLGLRAGVAGRYLRGTILVDPDPATGGLVCPSAICPAPGVTLDLLPFVGADVGIEHRFGRAFVMGLIAGVSYGGADYTAAQLTAEVSWQWY